MGDYTTTTFRNVANGFGWTHNDPTRVTKSLNGTPYFDIETEYDTFSGLNYSLVDDNDRSILEDLFTRSGKYNPMPMSIDPTLIVSDNINDLTRLARFNGNMSSTQVVRDRYNMSFGIEEVI